MQNIEELLIKHYSRDSEITNYSKIRLWEAEELLFDNYLKPGTRVLDVGCGAGRVSIILQERGFEVTGIDMTPRMIAKAKANASARGVKPEFKIMNAKKLLFNDESFDSIVIADNMINQVPTNKSRLNVMAECLRVLRRGGILYLNFLSILCPEFRHQLFINQGLPEQGDLLIEKSRGNWTFTHLINPLMLEEELKMIGYLIIEKQSVDLMTDSYGLCDYNPSDMSLIFILKK